MILKLQNIKQFIRSIKKDNIYQINLKVKIHKINIIINKVQKDNNIFKNNNIQLENIHHYEVLNNNTNDKLNNKEKEEVSEQFTNYSTIVSPMVGIFYRSPAPNESPFIEKNDLVNQKQTVCIIEAMKLMNEIEAEVNGEIVEILVKDGDIVDCGQALMTIKNI